MKNQNPIPTFPDFRPLELEDRFEFIRLTSKFKPYSDFNFTSLYCWRGDSLSEVSMLNGNIVIRLPDYLEKHKVYSMLGTHKVDESLVKLLEHTKSLKLVPEDVIRKIEHPEKFEIVEDPDNFDYIYNLDDLSSFSGGKHKKHRNKTNKFERDHEEHDVSVIVTTTITDEQAAIIRKIDRAWADEHAKTQGETLLETHALNNLLSNSDSFNLFVVEIVVNGELKAFSVNEMLDRDYAICHFEKAINSHHEYLATFLVNRVAQEIQKHGCKWVNWEQDLGLEGLRISKMSYKPMELLKKYTVALKR